MNAQEARKWCDDNRKHPVIGKMIINIQSWASEDLAIIIAFLTFGAASLPQATGTDWIKQAARDCHTAVHKWDGYGHASINQCHKCDELAEIIAARVPQATTETPDDYWIIRYDDAAVAPELLKDEGVARKVFADRLLNWNCQLFKMVDDGKRWAARATTGKERG